MELKLLNQNLMYTNEAGVCFELLLGLFANL